MKTLFLTLLTFSLIATSLQAQTQSTSLSPGQTTSQSTGLTAKAHILHVFAENGEKFFLIINGEKQNDKPLARVTVKDLDDEYYRGKIIFDDERLGEMNVNFQLAGVDPGFNDVTYIIKKKMKKGKPVFRLWPGSWKKIGEAPATAQTSDQEQALDIIALEPQPQPRPRNKAEALTQSTTNKSTEAIRNETAQQDVNKCGAPLPDASFQGMLTSVTNANFEDVKLQTANVIASGNCLTTGQIKQIIGKFNFEETRLAFAKTAYPRCLDKNNYLQVNDAFQFSSSKTALNEFVLKNK